MSFPPDDRTYEYRTGGFAPRTWTPAPAASVSPPGTYPPPSGFQFQPAHTSPPKKSRLGVVLVSVVGALVLIGGVALASVLTGIGPGAALTKDKGVRACEAISAVRDGRTLNVTGLGSGKDGIAILRDAFNHSRYDDLKAAGTAAMDLLRQFKGTSDDAATGLAIVAGGQMVEKWSALSGACSAHGVDIPNLADVGK